MIAAEYNESRLIKKTIKKDDYFILSHKICETIGVTVSYIDDNMSINEFINWEYGLK